MNGAGSITKIINGASLVMRHGLLVMLMNITFRRTMTLQMTFLPISCKLSIMKVLRMPLGNRSSNSIDFGTTNWASLWQSSSLDLGSSFTIGSTHMLSASISFTDLMMLQFQWPLNLQLFNAPKKLSIALMTGLSGPMKMLCILNVSKVLRVKFKFIVTSLLKRTKRTIYLVTMNMLRISAGQDIVLSIPTSINTLTIFNMLSVKWFTISMNSCMMLEEVQVINLQIRRRTHKLNHKLQDSTSSI